MTEPREGLLIDERFELEREIARGGMGTVWRAFHVRLDIPCAVKFIHHDAEEDSEMHERFRREARAAAKLKNSHVVQVLDYGVWEGLAYIAMELLDGEDLGERLEREGALLPDEVLTISSGIAAALDEAHACGIIHRDLKPENVFLARVGRGEVPKVVDFGIAKAIGVPGLTAKHNTKSGTVIGSPHYMSPEQADGTHPVDHRSDLWSYAVIMYECVVGLQPFRGAALGNLFVSIITRPLPIPTEENHDAPAGFDAWWDKAASREPAGRFDSALQMHKALSAVIAPALEPLKLAARPASTKRWGDVAVASTDPPVTSGDRKPAAARLGAATMPVPSEASASTEGRPPTEVALAHDAALFEVADDESAEFAVSLRGDENDRREVDDTRLSVLPDAPQPDASGSVRALTTPGALRHDNPTHHYGRTTVATLDGTAEAETTLRKRRIWPFAALVAGAAAVIGLWGLTTDTTPKEEPDAAAATARPSAATASPSEETTQATATDAPPSDDVPYPTEVTPPAPPPPTPAAATKATSAPSASPAEPVAATATAVASASARPPVAPPPSAEPTNVLSGEPADPGF